MNPVIAVIAACARENRATPQDVSQMVLFKVNS